LFSAAKYVDGHTEIIDGMAGPLATHFISPCKSFLVYRFLYGRVSSRFLIFNLSCIFHMCRMYIFHLHRCSRGVKVFPYEQ